MFLGLGKCGERLVVHLFFLGYSHLGHAMGIV